MRNRLGDKVIQASRVVSNMGLDNSDVDIRSIIRENLKRTIAQHIADKEVIEERMDHHTIFRMELLVLTPEELHQAMQEEVLERERFMNLTTMYENINKE